MCHDDSVSNVNHEIAEKLIANDNFLAIGHRARSSSQLSFVVNIHAYFHIVYSFCETYWANRKCSLKQINPCVQALLTFVLGFSEVTHHYSVSHHRNWECDPHFGWGKGIYMPRGSLLVRCNSQRAHKPLDLHSEFFGDNDIQNRRPCLFAKVGSRQI
jgi:hypothetical protein